jgi:hypothetical protein
LPILFIGHGSPMNAIENNEFSYSWIKAGKDRGSLAGGVSERGEGRGLAGGGVCWGPPDPCEGGCGGEGADEEEDRGEVGEVEGREKLSVAEFLMRWGKFRSITIMSG